MPGRHGACEHSFIDTCTWAVVVGVLQCKLPSAYLFGELHLLPMSVCPTSILVLRLILARSQRADETLADWHLFSRFVDMQVYSLTAIYYQHEGRPGVLGGQSAVRAKVAAASAAAAAASAAAAAGGVATGVTTPTVAVM